VNFGDIVIVDFGVPIGSEAEFRRQGVVVTAGDFPRFFGRRRSSQAAQLG
jgi:mRNA-degrading endonuclease toxin of MazEF toxin-antitoxin module